MNKPKFVFGDLVVVENCIGVVVKTWEGTGANLYEVYVRGLDRIVSFKEEQIERYRGGREFFDGEEGQ